MKNFDDFYECYVIFEKETNMFIGETTDSYRVASRNHAARFTKKAAMSYIKDGYFIEKNKTYSIQGVI